ncbi:MAG: carbohydrate ABC transporter permease [Eubacteriales bacterium]|nr:carbohydrate ABC transporter permease [Eubacteriales bacterium]
MVNRNNPARRIFIVCNYFFSSLIGLLCVVPILHVLAISFSSMDAVFSNRVLFWPVDFNLDNYNIVVRDSQFFQSYFVTIIRALLGWAFSLTMTVLAAYPMSLRKTTFPARPFFVAYFMGTMLFNGGMIPTYLVVKGTGLLDTIWALILPCALSTYNVILMMNFMKGLPEALSESAFLDGAGHWTTLWKIILPLCLPSLATISLFIVLAHWNAWFDGMIYIKNMALKPLQTYLRSIVIVDASVGDSAMYLEDLIANATADGSNGAKIFLALLPIMCIYPFLQKHFAKGIVRGSVKE